MLAIILAWDSVGSAHYSAAKAAIIGMTRALAAEWAPHGIRVNAIAPGAVRTEGFQALLDEGTTEPDADTMARLAEPDDIGGAVLLLSSRLARRVTGQTLVVDGGSSTANPFGLG